MNGEKVKETKLNDYTITEFFRKPFYELQWHAHENASINFVVTGTYEERFKKYGFNCKAHDMIFKPPLKAHSDHFGQIGGKCYFIEIGNKKLHEIQYATSLLKNEFVFSNSRTSAFGANIIHELDLMDDVSSLSIESSIFGIISETARQKNNLRNERKSPKWLKKAISYVHEYFSESISLSIIAKECNIHPSHFARTFRNNYHCSIGTYIRRLRINHATKLLSNSDDSIIDISLSCGFFDQAHFTKTFRDYTGMTPYQYRSFKLN